VGRNRKIKEITNGWNNGTLKVTTPTERGVVYDARRCFRRAPAPWSLSTP